MSASVSASFHYPVVIVGGGQAGLSVSYCLKQQAIDHVVFEQHQLAHSWRAKRWDTFCLVTPNWQCRLPGYPYPGDDPEGFMPRDEIVGYLESYAAAFEPPVKAGVTVLKVAQNTSSPGSRSLFAIQTSAGDFTADQVVVATGGYHHPKLPRMAERLPQSLVQLHASEYKNPESLPTGAVLVVGTGQSGCQIAEDLHRAGRQVHLCVGSAPRSPRRYRGKDVVDWLDQMGYYDMPIDEHPQKAAVRDKTNHYVTGRDGGKEIDLRQFALEGMRLYGRLAAITHTQLRFRDDLQENLDRADAVAASIKQTIDSYIAKNNLTAPSEPPYRPVWQPDSAVLTADLLSEGISVVIWSTGYRMDFSWVDVPVFNGSGYPCHERGVTPAEGLYFVGLPWLYTWGSGRFSGVAQDAAYIADYISLRNKTHHSTLQLQSEAALGSWIMGV